MGRRFAVKEVNFENFVGSFAILVYDFSITPLYTITACTCETLYIVHSATCNMYQNSLRSVNPRLGNRKCLLRNLCKNVMAAKD